MKSTIRTAHKTVAIIIMLIFVCIIMCVTGCGKKGETSKAKDTDRVTEKENVFGEEKEEATSTESDKGNNTLQTTEAKPENPTKDITTQEITTKSEAINSEETTANKNIAATGDYKPVTLAFTGDIYLSDILYNKYMTSGLTGFLGQSLIERFKNTDIMVCDHEYSATNLPDRYKADYQLFTFKAPTEREKLWKELQVDIVTLANNHTLDYGEQGLLDTFDALKANGISYIGAGKNLDEAIKADIREINGKKIAVLAASRFVPNTGWYAGENKIGLMTSYPGTDRFQMLKDEISRLKNQEGCDTVIVFVHFGTEKTNQINDNQPVIAHGYVDAGADAVIGCHAHTLQGIEIYNKAPIFYNLGNFLFESYSVDTAVANLTINEDNSVSASVTPCKSKGYLTTEAEGEESLRILKYIESISVNVNIDENGNITEK